MSTLPTVHTSPPPSTPIANEEPKEKELKYKSQLMKAGKILWGRGEGGFASKKTDWEKSVFILLLTQLQTQHKPDIMLTVITVNKSN
jgi:hypothetical protein